MRLGLFIIFICVFSAVLGQEEERFLQQLEFLAEQQESEAFDVSQIRMELVALSNHPLNLNKTSRGRIKKPWIVDRNTNSRLAQTSKGEWPSHKHL